MNLVATQMKADNIKAVHLTFDATACDLSTPTLQDVLNDRPPLVDDFYVKNGKITFTNENGEKRYVDLNDLTYEDFEKPKKISYICKNCNGHINPKTLKCEYCDTQY